MLPGLGGMNPAQMKAMMKQFGIKSEDLVVKRLVMELENETLVFERPNVTLVDMKGQKSYTVVGEPERVENGNASSPSHSSEDIEMVMQATQCSEDEARAALEKSGGDISEAIASLKNE